MRLLVVQARSPVIVDAIPHSPFDILETCFRLLASGPAPLGLDGRHVGHGLPARPIPLDELRVLLQHPAATSDLQLAVLGELVHLATEQRGRWMVALAGVLLPGLRRIAAPVASVDHRATVHVEADLLELVRKAIGQHASGAEQFALGVLQFTHPSRPSLPRAIWGRHPLGA
jgi:hypothetical protein